MMVFKFFVSFFSNIANFFKWIFLHDNLLTRFLSSMSKFDMYRLAINYAFKLAIYSAIVFLVGISVAFFFFITRAITILYNLISYFLDYISNPSSDTMLSGLFYFLKLTGITDGFITAFPFISMALIFILYKSLYVNVLRVGTKIFFMISSYSKI